MDEALTDMHAETRGSGQSVNVNLGEGFKQFQILFVALIIVLFVCVGIAIYALTEVNTIKAHVAELDTDNRLTAYWLQRVETILQAEGVKLPPDPTMKPRGVRK